MPIDFSKFKVDLFSSLKSCIKVDFSMFKVDFSELTIDFSKIKVDK